MALLGLKIKLTEQVTSLPSPNTPTHTQTATLGRPHYYPQPTFYAEIKDADLHPSHQTYFMVFAKLTRREFFLRFSILIS